jgi:hypothetical protein
MGRESEVERLFTKNIDRLLAGEKVPTEGLADEDLRTALNFAKKMIELRVSPSAQFESRLKAGLLGKIAEKERARESRQGWFWRLVPTQPLAQAIAIIAVLLVVGGALFAALRPTQQLMVKAPETNLPALTAPPSTAAPATVVPATTPAATSQPATPTAPAGGTLYIRSNASTDKSSYVPGEQVYIQVNMTNITKSAVILEQYPPTLSLMRVQTGQPVYTFTAGVTPRTINPGETATYSLSWDQLDAHGRHVTPGGYYVELEEVYRQGQSVHLDLAKPAYFNISTPTPAGGAAGSVSGLNQPLTVNGITITLTQMEFSSAGITATAFITPPPDYVLQQTITGLSPTLDYRTQVRYAVDSNWLEKTEPSLVEYFPDGMTQTWFMPSTSGREISGLTLIIDNIGPWQGPWEFKISIK